MNQKSTELSTRAEFLLFAVLSIPSWIVVAIWAADRLG